MTDSRFEVVKILSVPLTRDKQLALEKEFDRYASATNWVMKFMVTQHITKPERAIEALSESFGAEFDKRPSYLQDVVRTAKIEILEHRRLARTIRSMRDKKPFFKEGRMILSQPIVSVGKSALIFRLPDRTQMPIPYDKRSRNREADVLTHIVRGDSEQGNQRYDRVRLTWNKEGFVGIDIRARLDKMRRDS